MRKIVVFGATGGTGQQIVECGLAAGHRVVAVARKPEVIKTTHDRLQIMKGDVLDCASIDAAVAGADAVLSAIGPANNRRPGTLISVGVRNIVDSCEKAGVKRFVFESGLMVGDGHALSLFNRTATAIYRSMNRALCDDKRIAESTIRASTLEWVIVRPPALTGKPAKGGYRTGVDLALSVAKSLSHADVAEFLVAAATDDAIVRTIQDIGY